MARIRGGHVGVGLYVALMLARFKICNPLTSGTQHFSAIVARPLGYHHIYYCRARAGSPCIAQRVRMRGRRAWREGRANPWPANEGGQGWRCMGW